MGEEERRRCCLLGGCGCGPGSAAQRQAMKEWLLIDVLGSLPHDSTNGMNPEAWVEEWLDGLPWKKVADDDNDLSDPTGGAV